LIFPRFSEKQMHEHGLAKELWPQMQQIAADGGFVKVTGVDMVVGSLHMVQGDFLVHSFVDHAFGGTIFEGAEVNVRTVDPGERFTPAGSGEPRTADGWELMITRIEGDKAET
jgi:hypothetical protein